MLAVTRLVTRCPEVRGQLETAAHCSASAQLGIDLASPGTGHWPAAVARRGQLDLVMVDR